MNRAQRLTGKKRKNNKRMQRYACRVISMAGTSGEIDKEDYSGVFASYVTRRKNACPNKKFKERSP